MATVVFHQPGLTVGTTAPSSSWITTLPEDSAVRPCLLAQHRRDKTTRSWLPQKRPGQYLRRLEHHRNTDRDVRPQHRAVHIEQRLDRKKAREREAAHERQSASPHKRRRIGGNLPRQGSTRIPDLSNQLTRLGEHAVGLGLASPQESKDSLISPVATPPHLDEPERAANDQTKKYMARLVGRRDLCRETQSKSASVIRELRLDRRRSREPASPDALEARTAWINQMIVQAGKHPEVEKLEGKAGMVSPGIPILKHNRSPQAKGGHGNSTKKRRCGFAVGKLIQQYGELGVQDVVDASPRVAIGNL